MISCNLFDKSELHHITDSMGIFSVLEYDRDISISPEQAEIAYFASQMNVKKRQLLVNLDYNTGVIVQAGAMQIMMGDIKVSTDVSGPVDLAKKLVGSRVTNETAIKPKYTGHGTLVLEPTFRHIIFEDLSEWNGSMVVEDGMFMACTELVKLSVTSRSTVSSAVLGNEGLFNTCLTGPGIAALESPVPKEELIVVELNNDTVKIDGKMAIAWSNTLKFTVERTTATLVGSFASGEGLVNVYRGTGKVLIAPVQNNKNISSPDTK